MSDNAEGFDDRLFELGRALGCRVRLAVLRALAAGDASVGELVTLTGATQPNVSNHLAVLRSAGLVSYHREGRGVRYRLASADAADLVHNLSALAGDDSDDSASQGQSPAMVSGSTPR